MSLTRSHRSTPAWTGWVFWALVGFMAAGSVGAATETPIRSIEIVQDSDGYVANAVMFAPVPTRVAWEVLTDFENMARWVPNVRESKVVARESNSLTVEQHGVAKFGLASFSYESVRQMDLDPQQTIRSKQLKGNMRRLESLMTLAPDGAGTRLTYRLQMTPSGLAAAVLSKEFLEHEIGEQFAAIVGEMVRRNR
jgi:carbon monoxide dehydrogenase subunit G